MDDGAREQLARQQREMLDAIFDGGTRPQGIDRAQLDYAAGTLLAKRRREASLCMPQVAASLGERFVTLFDRFAENHPYPTRGGPAADAAGFAAHFLKTERIPVSEMALRELLALRGRRGHLLQLGVAGKGLLLSVRTGPSVRLFRVLRWG